jgi:hypothetical protein
VLDNLILIENLIEDGEGAAATDHIVFGDDFEPVDDRFLGEDVVVVGHSQSDANPVLCKRVESICGHGPIRSDLKRREDVGSLRKAASPQHGRLKLRWGRAVGCTGSLTFAAVLASMFLVAAALAFAVVLAFAGMLCGIGGLLWCDLYSGLRRRVVLSSGLRVETNGRTAKETSKCGREGQVGCGVNFHREHLSWLGRAICEA